MATMPKNIAELPLELRIESFKCLSNLSDKLFQAVYDQRPVCKSYLDGSIAIHAHFMSGKNGICCTIVKAELNGISDDTEMHVLVGVGDIPEKLRPITSVVRLQPLEHCPVFSRETFQMPELTPKILFRIYNDKLSFLDNTFGVEACQLIDEVIQGRSEIVNNICNKPTNFEGGLDIAGSTSRTNGHLNLTAFEVDKPLLILQGNVISYDFGKFQNVRPERIQVFPCPVNLLISAIERLHSIAHPAQMRANNY